MENCKQKSRNTPEQAKAEADKGELAFGVTRLREDYRLKPKKDAEPAFYGTNPYNGKTQPRYRIKDCVPIRTKKRKPKTESQEKASKLLGLKAKQRSKLYRTSTRLNEFVATLPKPLAFLDTETTDIRGEVIELGLVDSAGETIYHSYYKPVGRISEGALNKHGISEKSLEDKPSFADELPKLKAVLAQYSIGIYNEGFDLDVIHRSCKLHDQPTEWISELSTFCMMVQAVRAFGSTNSYGSISLENAMYESETDWQGAAHGAIADSLATLSVYNHIIAYKYEIDSQIQKLTEVL